MNFNELMNQPDAFNLLEIDEITKEPYANSLKLAKVIGRGHNEVLLAIRKQKKRTEDVLAGLLEDETPNGLLPLLKEVNPVFTTDEYHNEQNDGWYPAYRLNQDACIVTLAQLQGKKAVAWILAYMGAFNVARKMTTKQKDSLAYRVEMITDHVINKRFDKLEKLVLQQIEKEIKRLR